MGIIEDILDSIAEVMKTGYQPKFIVISPRGVSQLLQDERFMDISRYGNKTSFRQGEIGRIFGISIVVVTDWNKLSPNDFEENDNPSSRLKIKPKEVIVISDHI